MTISAFRINDALELTPLEPQSALEISERANASVWIDFDGLESSELEGWLDKLGITRLSRKLCMEASDRPAFYPLKEEILFVIPVLADTQSPREVVYLTLLCRQNFLLTFHLKPVFSQEQLASLQDSPDWLNECSVESLVAAMLIDLSLDGLRHNAGLRDSIRDLENRMDREPDSVEADEILDQRSKLLILDAVISAQLPTVKTLNATEKSFFEIARAREYMNCALANLQAADSSLDRLDNRIVALRNGFQMHAQEKTNRRLGMLTILSAIFMPITLMAGIWGMNFENMPELKQPYAYPVALGAMALIGAGMFRFFRTNRWFD